MLGRFLESNHYFFGQGGGCGWGGRKEIKANSAQFQVKLPTGADLGNITEREPYFPPYF